MLLQPFGQINKEEQGKKAEELIGLYRRVSADEQKKSGLGLEGQEFACREFIKKKFPNAKIVEVYSDEGLSADKYSIDERKQLNKMLADAKIGKINIIVTFKQDRLARKTEELEYICKATEYFECRIFEADGGTQINEATPQNILQRQMLASFSQFEIELTRSRVNATKAGQKKNGKFSGGDVPYGFIWDKENSKVIEVDEEIRVWLSIIHKYLFENKGSVIIARELNEDNIPYRTGDKAYDKDGIQSWSKENVLSLLKNPILTGKFATNVLTRWKDENGKRRVKRNKPQEYILQETDLLREIIPLEMWKMIIDKLDDKTNHKVPHKVMTTSFVLSGIIKCGYCEATLLTKRDKRKRKDGSVAVYSYYVCKNPNCHAPIKSYKQDEVENYVLSEMKENFSLEKIGKDDVTGMTNEFLTEESDNLKNSIELLKSQQEKIKQDLEKIDDDYFKGELNAQNFQRFQDKLNTELLEVNEKLKIKDLEYHSRAEKKEEVVDLIEAIEAFNEAFSHTEEEDEVLNSRKRALILTLLDEVKFVNGAYKIVYRYETGSEIPSHLKRSLDKQLNTVFAEIIKGQKEVSATSEVWVDKVRSRPMLHHNHLQDNYKLYRLMNIFTTWNGSKTKEDVESKNSITPKVS